MVRVVLIGFALLAAATAGWLVKHYLSAQREQLAEMAAHQVPKPVPTTEVLVVTRNVGIASVLSSGDLNWESWPDRGLNEHYITRRSRPHALDELGGAAARQPLFTGEPVTEDKLILMRDGSFLAAVLPHGGRAITLKIDEATGLAGLILPGDRVDVIVTHEVPVKVASGVVPERQVVSETIVHELRVLAIDQELKQEGNKPPKLGKTVTLAVDIGQAEAIAVAEKLGTLTLSLCSAFGAAVADARERPYTSASDISGALRAAAAAAVPPPEAPVVAPPAPYSVTVFHGVTAETITLTR